MLDDIGHVHRLAVGIHESDVQVLAREHLAQLVAHQVHDGLEVQRARDALLDAVDQRQLGCALLGGRRALGHLLLQPLLRAQVGQRHGGLGGQGGQQVTVAVV